jgi:deoxycytidylate deaminase
MNNNNNTIDENNINTNVTNKQDDMYCVPCNEKVKKREDVIKWDEYFMAVAFLSSMRSKDPSTQVGACIGKIISYLIF